MSSLSPRAARAAALVAFIFLGATGCTAQDRPDTRATTGLEATPRGSARSITDTIPLPEVAPGNAFTDVTRAAGINAVHRLPGDQDIPRYTKDLMRDPVYRFLDRSMLAWQIVLAVLLFAWGGWPFVVWGIFVRMVTLYHCTWFVNSATHRFGYRTYPCPDQSTNCWWVALLTFGEGWHNNHHAFPFSARHGLAWWEIDLSYMVIRLMTLVGLAWKLRVPAPEAIQAKQDRSASTSAPALSP